MLEYDVIIIGAGAAGLMCAMEAGKRGRRVLLLDHANKPGKKILMSGGGRCNFTNQDIRPENYLSKNPHFCKSALSRYTQWDFIAMVQRHSIPFHEKTLGQLFCNNKAKDIVNMLLLECEWANVELVLEAKVIAVKQNQDAGFTLQSSLGALSCESLVIATGGLSIPTMGASPFAYKIAEQFSLPVLPTRAGLVPFTLHVEDKQRFADLSGISLEAIVSANGTSFRENILFTHRGLSGPAILQISSYWQPGRKVSLNVLPGIDFLAACKTAELTQPLKLCKNFLVTLLPKRVVDVFLPTHLGEKNLASCSHQDFATLHQQFCEWHISPNGTEGYRTAEVTLGGVDTDVLSSKTFAVKAIPNLYFIGESVDVSGWLGGYNFQWAWSSGWAAGQAV
jgi:predicted Rossmann fold flavoprotein